MGFEIMEESHGNLVAVRATGHPSDDDFAEVVLPQLEETLTVQGSLRVLIYLDEGFEVYEPSAIWGDANYDAAHIGEASGGEFEKLAVVGGDGWDGRLRDVLGTGEPVQVERFQTSELDQAMEWVTH